ncbi:MAG: pyruvate formate-lyase-activating protein [Patescibacteria group bacterium]|nr:pyruvate formate-lyase-activating protein [Patescibacteria group bacterium]
MGTLPLKVHSFESLGTHEGPGIRLVVFLQGCHLRCLYCHNPDTWHLEGGTFVMPEEILTMLEKERPYFSSGGGLTVSGGEPLIQRHALYDLFSMARKAGFNTALDTNGAILDDATRNLLTETDLVLLDLKDVREEHHKKLTGVSNYVPLAFADYLEKIGKRYWVRHVLVPGYTLQPEHLHLLGRRLAGRKALERLEILPYHTYGVYKYKELGIPYQLSGLQPPGPEQVAEAKQILQQYIPDVRIR